MANYLGKIVPAMDETRFTWIKPEPTIRYLLTVEESRFIRANTKLNELLPRKLSIALSPDGTQIILKEGKGDCFVCVKDGRIKNKAIGNVLIKLNHKLPVCYLMQLTDSGIWYGDLLPPQEHSNLSNIPKKPRTGGLGRIGKELADAS